MVTGQLFSMPQGNKIKSKDTSLIILNKEGFTFTNNLSSEFISKRIIPFSVTEKTDKWINDNLVNNYKVEVIIANNSSLFVPKILFDDEFIESYYEKNDKIKDTDKIISETSENHLNEIIYKISKQSDSFLKKISNYTGTKHLNTLIYNYLTKENKGNLKTKLYVNISEDFFNIFIFHGQELHLINSYSNEGRESFLYYLFYIIEKKELTKNKFVISFLGKYDCFEKYYQDTLKYHGNIEFMFSNNDKTRKGINPFIIDLYENYILKNYLPCDFEFFCLFLRYLLM